MNQPPTGYTGLVGIGCLYLEEDDIAEGIRNLREVNYAERYVVWVRRWSIVPRLKFETCGRFGHESTSRRLNRTGGNC